MSYRKTQYIRAFGGGEDAKPTVKTTVVKQPDRFVAWGDLAQDAQAKGWYPTMWNGDVIEYRNGGQNNFNAVEIPNEKEKGYISVVGNKNGKMNVFIKKANGDIDRTLLTDANPQDVDNYFRSKTSTLQNRTDKLIQNATASL